VAVVAGGEVIPGSDGDAGQIIRGDCHSDRFIGASILGKVSNLKTALSAGGDGSVQNRLLS